MGRATLPAGLSRRVGQDVGPHPVGTHRWAAKGGPVHGKTRLSGPSGKEVGQNLRTVLQAQQVKTPLPNWPTRRAGWNQLTTTPLSNWPTRRAGWHRLTKTPLSNWPTRRAGWHHPYQILFVTRTVQVSLCGRLHRWSGRTHPPN